MERKREKIELHPVILLQLIEKNQDLKNRYVTVQNICTSSDDEDGGGHYNLVIKRLSDNKFFSTEYSEWDIENTDFNSEDDENTERVVDLDCILFEVFPIEKTVTVYE